MGLGPECPNAARSIADQRTSFVKSKCGEVDATLCVSPCAACWQLDASLCPAQPLGFQHPSGRGFQVSGSDPEIFTSFQSASTQFLGGTAWFPIGPWVLASALKCPVILFSVLREGESYRVRFEKLADRVELPRGRREAAAAEYVALYAKKLEQLCRESPYDWFNFFPFWEPPRA